jgi:phage tail-like protein
MLTIRLLGDSDFTVSPTWFDPYKNLKFRIKWDGKNVARLSKNDSLKRTTQVVKYREGGDPGPSHKSSGITEYEAITLERGYSWPRILRSGLTRYGTTGLDCWQVG